MKLNLGCSNDIRPGYINADRNAKDPRVTLVDLDYLWPWDNNSIDEILAYDIIEHLYDKIRTMNELHRVLKPGGKVHIVVPTTDGPGAFQDPTHVSYWNYNSFKYYEDGNGYRDRFADSYGITAKFKIIDAKIDASIDGPKLFIILSAVK